MGRWGIGTCGSRFCGNHSYVALVVKQVKPRVPSRRPCVVPGNGRATQGTARHPGPTRRILQVPALALIRAIRGSPTPRPRTPSAVHHALRGLEVCGSGGDILQGTAAMAVCARGTHPPARVRGDRNDGAAAARDNVWIVAELDQERARGPPCATCSGRTESGGQFCPGAETVPNGVTQARRGRNRRLARATTGQDRQTQEGGDARSTEDIANGKRRRKHTGRRSGRRCTGRTGTRGG